MYIKGSERGQILLIVVITMIVALTVGLSVASRTITELRLSTQNEESQRAFNAAESGIDRVLQQGGNVSGLDEPVQLGNNATFDVVSEEYGGAQILLNNGEQVDQGIGADVWLSNYEEPMFSSKVTTSLNIFWGEEGQTLCATPSDAEQRDSVRPALEVVVLQGADENNPSIEKFLYDTCPSRTIGSLDGSTYDNLSPHTVSGIPGETFLNRTSSDISISDGIIMKVIPLYNSTKVAISADDALPSQGSVIESTGESGDTVRKIIYYQSYPQIPLELFPYSIISQ